MGKYQREKGKRGEREFCRYLRKRGYGAIRSAQHSGTSAFNDSADVITSMQDRVRWEVKKGYNDVPFWTAEFREWIATARDETPDGQLWALAWTPDYVSEFYFVLEGPKGGFVIVQNFDTVESALNVSNYKVEDPESWPE